MIVLVSVLVLVLVLVLGLVLVLVLVPVHKVIRLAPGRCATNRLYDNLASARKMRYSIVLSQLQALVINGALLVRGVSDDTPTMEGA